MSGTSLGSGSEPALLGIDIGTTHSKAALFTASGRLLGTSQRPTPSYKDGGFDRYDPERLWLAVRELIRDVIEVAGDLRGRDVAAVGITSMAESGLLVDRRTGEARSAFIPWHCPCSQPQAQLIAREADPLERFVRTGLRPSFKYGLAKLLWIRDHDPEALSSAGGEPVWLSASDYIAYRLTGAMATDFTLAARTFAFDIASKYWDTDWIRHFGLPPAIFPEARRSGTPIGSVSSDAARSVGLADGIPVVIAGHDHVCAALAAGSHVAGAVMDSMGTAETLVGMLPERLLSKEDLESGLAFGCHVVPDAMFWMGGIPASGGSVEWLRSVMAEPELSYDQVIRLLDEAGPEPTGILYYPYLAGSGSPQPDARAKAAFVGLQAAHGRPELLKSVLEGTAYEMESIRRTSECVTGGRPDFITVVGGGTRNKRWLQIKADISGIPLRRTDLAETALLGAAMLAAAGCGLYKDAAEAAQIMGAASEAARGTEMIRPQTKLHEQYTQLYEKGYMLLQEPLRKLYHINIEER